MTAANQSDWPQESLKGPVLSSLILHASVFGLILLIAGLKAANQVQLGGVARDGGSISITTSPILLPRNTTKLNPVAHDSKSNLPTPPKPQPKPAKVEEADAKPLPSLERQKPKLREQNLHPEKPLKEEPKRYGMTGQQMANPMYSGEAGIGGPGVRSSNPFGDRFAAYAALLQQRVSAQWLMQTRNLGNRAPEGTTAVVSAEIQTDGSVKNVNLSKPSGDYSVDTAALRAVQAAAPFDHLPLGFNQSSAIVDFQITVKR